MTRNRDYFWRTQIKMKPIKQKDLFYELLQSKEDKNIIKEIDYRNLIYVVKKISTGAKNYLLLGDFNSASLLKVSRNTLKTIKKVDENLSKIDPVKLSEISNHIETISMLTKEISELSKMDNNKKT